VDKGFCQSTAYRSKLTAKLQFTAAKANIGGYGVIYNLTAKQQLIYQ